MDNSNQRDLLVAHTPERPEAARLRSRSFTRVFETSFQQEAPAMSAGANADYSTD